jgi:predicted AlkP superfamily phosphohydrolase/phosphomutase
VYTKAYERDVRLGASVRASEIFLELSATGSELSELKKARKQEEKFIRSKVRQEYDDLVAELSSQIHKLKARFNEFRISSVEEAMSALSEIKREDLLQFVNKNYSPLSETTGNTFITLQASIDDLRDDNAELKQVVCLSFFLIFKD